MCAISSPPEITPLQDKLTVLAKDFGKIGLIFAILVFHGILLRQFAEGLMYRSFDLSGGPRRYY